MGFRISLHRTGSTLFWDHTSRDHLHTGTKFSEALITKETCELTIPLSSEDDMKWWNKCVDFLRVQKTFYQPLPDAP